MCGIFGMIGDGVNKEDLKICYELGITAMVRGIDSAGFYEVNTRRQDFAKHATLHKDNNDFSYFSWHHMMTEEAKKNYKLRILNSVTNNFFVGHTRHATVGAVTKENSQPIETEDYIIIHNGTMNDKEYDSKTDEISDSRMLAADIQARGLKTVLRGVDDRSQFALVVFDKKNKEIHFARNIYRTLSFAMNKKRDVLYFASESGQLRWILDRNRADFENIFSLKEGVIWTTTPSRIKQKSNMFIEHGTWYSWVKEGDKWNCVWERDKEKKPPESPKVQQTQLLEHKKEETGATILPFQGPKRVTSQYGTDLSVPCGLCGRSIGVLQQHYIRTKPYLGYHNVDTGAYYCDCIGKAHDEAKVH